MPEVELRPAEKLTAAGGCIEGVGAEGAGEDEGGWRLIGDASGRTAEGTGAFAKETESARERLVMGGAAVAEAEVMDGEAPGNMTKD